MLAVDLQLRRVRVQTPGLVYGANNETLTVFISASQPANGTANHANWLPAPNNAPIFFILRTYVTTASAIAGNYAPPAFIRTEAAGVATAGKKK